MKREVPAIRYESLDDAIQAANHPMNRELGLIPMKTELPGWVLVTSTVSKVSQLLRGMVAPIFTGTFNN